MKDGLITTAGLQKAVAVFGVVCLVVIFLSSVWNRIQSPSIVIDTHAGQQQQQDMMARVTSLMEEVERNPENVEALSELANAFMRLENWERAFTFWERVLDVEPNHEMALNQAGFTLFQQGRYSQAAEYFQRLLEINPENYHSHFNLAIIYKYHLDEQELAENHLERILELDPDHPELLDRVRQELESPAPGEGS